MEWNVIQGLIKAELLVLVAACWVIGYVLKQTPRVPNWSIVYIVTGVAVVVCLLLTGLNVEAFIQGILVGAVSVYGHQLVKQGGNAGADTDAGKE
ncbi:Phage holin family Hol44, holin superfamily V [Paenibacillus algorifonticola]|uniref:Phage holin family Hol44, holin superfamily V n=1 Tax=Paenibacillus algorifonticola TaxID=684063 RepID=A0A1I2GZX1_9BACL|nr:phage holin family protein [Paenibacillus algorifonticola]SFF23345.1 Phage holin family Hol44, holin superfamily V [Paenibacillus algorifonticola]